MYFAAEAAAQQSSRDCAGVLGSQFLCASPAWQLTKPHTAQTWLIFHNFCFMGQGLNGDQQDEIPGLWNFSRLPIMSVSDKAEKIIRVLNT